MRSHQPPHLFRTTVPKGPGWSQASHEAHARAFHAWQTLPEAAAATCWNAREANGNATLKIARHAQEECTRTQGKFCGSAMDEPEAMRAIDAKMLAACGVS